jgi:hypothetical protein
MCPFLLLLRGGITLLVACDITPNNVSLAAVKLISCRYLFAIRYDKILSLRLRLQLPVDDSEIMFVIVLVS